MDENKVTIKDAEQLYLLIHTPSTTHAEVMSKSEYEEFQSWLKSDSNYIFADRPWYAINRKTKLLILYRKYITSVEVYSDCIEFNIEKKSKNKG